MLGRGMPAAGFTLVEMIVTLVLLGIVGALAGFGFLQGVKSFTFSKENTERALQLQLAMSRLQLEFENLYDVYTVGDEEVCYGTRHQSLRPNQKRCAWLQGSELRMENGETPTGGKVLINGIQSLNISYFDNEGNKWALGDKVKNLYAIQVNMIALINDETMTVNGSFNPRRNLRYNAPYMWNKDE